MEIEIIVDLRNRFGMARDQGRRPTCMAFATSDAHSFARDSAEPLSVEYLFFHAVDRTAHKDRTRGIAFRHISEAISQDGQPPETSWLYLANLSAADEWNPPSAVGPIFYRRSNSVTATVPAIYARLDGGHPAILSINIGISFFQADLRSLPLLQSAERTVATHAVLAVGYGKIDTGNCLLVRNSWGEGWADRGYGWIHEAYLTPRLLGVGIML
jgi:hypothetical protein